MQKVVTENGITLLVHSDPRFHSVAYAVCLLGGLSDETPESVGITHFLEHLLFKRTKELSTQQIACAIDELGGDVNAFTDFDSMCLFGTVPSSRADRLMDFVAGLLLDAAFDDQDLEVEREVIRQEIFEAHDNPGDALYQKLCSVLWSESIFRFPVFGTLEVLAELKREDIFARLKQLLHGKRLLIAAAGNVSVEEVKAHVVRSYGKLPPGETIKIEPPKQGSGFALVDRPVRQVYVALANRFPSLRDTEYPSALVASMALGDGMSSRLFRQLREERGLAYDVAAQVDSFSVASTLLVSATVEPHAVPTVLELVLGELEKVRKDSFETQEIERVVAMVTAQLEMEGDSVSSLLWRAIETELYFGNYVSPEEAVKIYQKIDPSQVAAVVQRYFDSENIDSENINSENIEPKSPAARNLPSIVLGGDVSAVDLAAVRMVLERFGMAAEVVSNLN